MVDFDRLLQQVMLYLCIVKQFVMTGMDLCCQEQKSRMCLPHEEQTLHQFLPLKPEPFQDKLLHCSLTVL
jgi:hypothetical protein